MSGIVITIKDRELLELQEILLDDDAASALAFLKAHVGSNIPSKGSDNCDSSRRNPYLLKPDAAD